MSGIASLGRSRRRPIRPSRGPSDDTLPPRSEGDPAAVLAETESLATPAQARAWLESLPARAAALAAPFSALCLRPGLPRLRTFCPLCGGGPPSPTLCGYSFPHGLTQHLWGARRAAPCPALESVRRRAQDPDTLAQDIGRHIERQRAERPTQTLYQLGPNEAPRRPEQMPPGGAMRPREASHLAAAAARLAAIGFTRHCFGRIVSFRYETAEAIVYADPRIHGALYFKAYRKPLPRPGSVRSRRRAAVSFSLPDRTVRNLIPRFQQQLCRALVTLTGRWPQGLARCVPRTHAGREDPLDPEAQQA